MLISICTRTITRRRTIMPYILGWLLGVPIFVLVILYLIFH